jgi:hypothetical protein
MKHTTTLFGFLLFFAVTGIGQQKVWDPNAHEPKISDISFSDMTCSSIQIEGVFITQTDTIFSFKCDNEPRSIKKKDMFFVVCNVEIFEPDIITLHYTRQGQERHVKFSVSGKTKPLRQYFRGIDGEIKLF